MKHPGFSLLEMLTTLAILSLLVAVFFPIVLQKPKPSLKSGDLRALLIEARVDSLAYRRSVTIMFDLRNRQIKSQDGRRSLRFADTTDVRVTYGRSQSTVGSGDGVPSITFLPDGRSTGGIIEVKNAGSNSFNMEVRWQDGAIEYVRK